LQLEADSEKQAAAKKKSELDKQHATAQLGKKRPLATQQSIVSIFQRTQAA
jgi:hypothetical protein